VNFENHPQERDHDRRDRRHASGLTDAATFEVDLRSGELRRNGVPVRMQNQPFQVFVCLLRHQGEVVTRDDLRRLLWPDGTFVDFEHSLNTAIKRLRVTLGDSAAAPRFIETLQRRGYRFIGSITGTSETLTVFKGSCDGRPTNLHNRTRILVLPLRSLSIEPRYAVFSDGLREEVVTHLSRRSQERISVISERFVVDRHDSKRIRYPADYLLEGSVRCQGGRARVIVRLVETASETYVWAETYEEDLTQCLTGQVDLAGRIVRSLTLKLLPDRSRNAMPWSGSTSGLTAALMA
jgi:TolB-like protein